MTSAKNIRLRARDDLGHLVCGLLLAGEEVAS